MRPFEVTLISASFLSLFPGFRKQSRSVWLGAAGANLVVFLIHALFEGFHYQMAFSYVSTILFAVYAAVKTNDRFIEAKTPKAFKVIAVSLCFVFLATTSFLAYALPVFTLPKPTGSYAVGIKVSRAEKSRFALSWYASLETKTRPFGRAFFGGEGGIRTLGGHEAHNGFRDRPIQPLWHLPNSIYDLRLTIVD